MAGLASGLTAKELCRTLEDAEIRPLPVKSFITLRGIHVSSFQKRYTPTPYQRKPPESVPSGGFFVSKSFGSC